MSTQLRIPCLGRPFNLGMLYNCRTEQVVPGVTLWKAEKLESESTKMTTEQPSSGCKIITDDSLQSKLSSLGIGMDMKLSVISGLANVEGAAKYLLDIRSSEKQSRVTLHFTSTTHFEQLVIDQLGDIDLLDEQAATHVVTGITYGADAFFIFDCPIGKDEQLEDARGSMEAAIETIPACAQSSSKDVSWKRNEIHGTDKFDCKFYGDMILSSNPATFEEAVEHYRTLPTLLNSHSVAKPKTVYLSPLSKFIGKPYQVVQSISPNLVYQVEEMMEHFHHTEMKANDLMKHKMCIKFSDIGSQLSKFKKLFTHFKTNFLENFSQLLPRIRRSEEEEKKLAELILQMDKSPFNFNEAKKFLQNKDKEMKLLSHFLINMETQCTLYFDFPDTNDDVVTLSNNDKIKHVACFAFNITSETCAYLENLNGYIKTWETNPAADQEWFDIPETIEQLKSEITKFLSLVENTEKTAFVVTSSHRDTSKPDPSIAIYTAGIPMLIDLPGTPKATNTTVDSITLSWTPPKHGEVSSYKVLYQPKGEPELKTVKSLGVVTTQCIQGLSHGVEYEFRVQATYTSGFPLESNVAWIKTREYYDIVIVGKTGQGKSTLGNKLLNVKNTDESRIQVFLPTSLSIPTTAVAYSTSETASSSPATESSLVTTSFPTSKTVSSSLATSMAPSAMPTPSIAKTSAASEKRFLQADDPEVGEQVFSITKECKLLSNEDTKVRVLDVPGFSDSGTLQKAVGGGISVYNGNLQIIRWVVREQLRSQLKVRRIVYFLPVRGPLEKADGTMQEELQVLHHFFGQEVFNCMVVAATNPPKKKFQQLGFDDDDYNETSRVFHHALKKAINDEDIDCPPIVYVGMNDSPEETLSKIRNAEVLKQVMVPLKFKDDTCARCSVKVRSNELNEKIFVIDADGKTIPYAKSKCHPSFIPKYSTAEKLLGGFAHVATLGICLILENSWPGFTNSDEICISCKQSPGAKGCQLIGKELTLAPHSSNKTVRTDHSSVV